MYLYFDNGGTLRTLIPHGEIPRQGNPLNLYLCFDEDRFDEESRQNFIIKIRFTFPDGTLSNEYTINPLQTDSNNNGYYLGLQQFEKLSDSEITFALKPGMEYHMFKYGFTGADRITTLYGKVLIHISFVYKEYDEEGNVLGENVYEENGTFHIERTIGSNLKQSVITPDEYTELQNLINRYILEFNDITFITDVESLESIELPDIRHLYRVRNAEGKLEYYNYRYEKWHRFVTGDEFADLVAKNNNHEQRISVLEPKVENLENKTKNHDESIEELKNKQTDLQDQIYDEVDDREREVKRLDDRIDQHETVVEELSQDVDNRFATVNENLNKKINRDFSGLGVASSVHKEDTVIVRCAGCNGGPASTYTLTVGALTALINSEVDYFKGYHASLAALQAAHPTGEPGDYAFVATENNDQYHMYVWDEEQKPGRWEETISGQYLLASSFETFQQGLMDGSIHVGAVKGNVNDTEETDPLLVNIEINGDKYVLPSVALDFLGEPVKDAYKLGAITINGDAWNVNNDIVTFEMSDENIEEAYELGSININGNKWNVVKGSYVEKKLKEFKNYLDANSFNKGEFLSFEKLQEKHPEGKPGEFAFVNTPTDQGDIMLMYIWDDDSKVWRETTSNQYVLTSVFENFKEELDQRIEELDIDSVISVKELPENGKTNNFYRVDGESKYLPNHGLVNNIYFNMSLSTQDVIKFFDKINPEIWTVDSESRQSYIIFVDETLTYNAKIIKNIVDDGVYNYSVNVINASDEIEIFSSANGWNSEFNGFIEVNSNLLSILNGAFVGLENEKLLMFVGEEKYFGTDKNGYYNNDGKNWIKLLTNNDQLDISLTFSSKREEGANDLGSIKIGNDVWNIPNGNSNSNVEQDSSEKEIPFNLETAIIEKQNGIFNVKFYFYAGDFYTLLKNALNESFKIGLKYFQSENLETWLPLACYKIENNKIIGIFGASSKATSFDDESYFVVSSENSVYFEYEQNCLSFIVGKDTNIVNEEGEFVISSAKISYYKAVAGGASNAEPLTLELSSERQEGANELGSIRIGNDVWNMPQGGGSSGGGNISNNEGSGIKKITFTDRPSLYEWLVSNYKNVIKFQIEQGSGDDYMFYNFSTVTKVNHGQLGIQFCVSLNEGYLDAENEPDTTTTIFSIKENQVQQVNLRHFESNNELEPQIDGMVLPDEYWSSLNVTVTCVYIEL